ncbi:hypothetical protein NPIL_452071 [Nephila pilipes]|uniref:Uncharacterized protein n=1 Tax=Nephila pilipes TaxID=299642 RepID=A0A8X6UQ56_NEPPI|nr:hypothetical protein NPIL_452071 [Nephila pilipes]
MSHGDSMTRLDVTYINLHRSRNDFGSIASHRSYISHSTKLSFSHEDTAPPTDHKSDIFKRKNQETQMRYDGYYAEKIQLSRHLPLKLLNVLRSSGGQLQINGHRAMNTQRRGKDLWSMQAVP